jgi:hypothetical protein
MNLLGHFVCARHLPVAAQAGSALGDLLPLYHRRLRPLALVRHWSNSRGDDPEMATVAEGVRFHLEVDSRFHCDPLFTGLSAKLQGAMREASSAPGLKRFFAAHVLAEMFLDQLLMDADGGAVDAFYALFRGRSLELSAGFAAAHPLGDPRTFRRFLERIAADRFLDGYRSFEGMLARVQRLLTRFGQRELVPAEAETLRLTLAALREWASGELLQFVAAMRHALPGLAAPGAAGTGDACQPGARAWNGPADAPGPVAASILPDVFQAGGDCPPAGGLAGLTRPG